MPIILPLFDICSRKFAKTIDYDQVREYSDFTYRRMLKTINEHYSWYISHYNVYFLESLEDDFMGLAYASYIDNRKFIEHYAKILTEKYSISTIANVILVVSLKKNNYELMDYAFSLGADKFYKICDKLSISGDIDGCKIVLKWACRIDNEHPGSHIEKDCIQMIIQAATRTDNDVLCELIYNVSLKYFKNPNISPEHIIDKHNVRRWYCEKHRKNPQRLYNYASSLLKNNNGTILRRIAAEAILTALEFKANNPNGYSDEYLFIILHKPLFSHHRKLI